MRLCVPVSEACQDCRKPFADEALGRRGEAGRTVYGLPCLVFRLPLTGQKSYKDVVRSSKARRHKKQEMCQCRFADTVKKLEYFDIFVAARPRRTFQKETYKEFSTAVT